MTRPGWDEYFLGIATAVASRADCTRAQVGALIVAERRIVATGYNGSEPGGRSCLQGQCPRGTKTAEEVPHYTSGNHDFSDCISLHAEQNAIAHANRSDTSGATMYCTHSPCDMCLKLIKAAGIVRLVWPAGEQVLARASNPVVSS